MDFDLILEKFEEFVSNYDIFDEKINLKYIHSIKVSEICRELATKLNLSDEQILLSQIIGLLHDIGRFEQIKKYDSFKDNNMDHADYGVKILFEDNLIRNFLLDNKYDNIIKCVIESHNKYNFPWYYKDDVLLFSKIIRDADKIDIYRVLSKRKNEFLVIPDDIELKQFFNKKPIKKRYESENKSNSILMTLAFIFDINFSESFKILKEKNYFEEYINSIRVSKENEKLFKKINKIIRKYLRGEKYDK